MPTYYNIPNLKVSIILPIPRLNIWRPQGLKVTCEVFPWCCAAVGFRYTMSCPICHLLTKVFKAVLRINTELSMHSLSY